MSETKRSMKSRRSKESPIEERRK